MKSLRIVLVLSALIMAAAAANAQATRTWVSGVGDDVNPCSRTAPCKTFAGAISKTAAGGEISVLDPGGFGTITITKSITINGDGSLGGILASLVNGVIVNAGVNDRVVLRNISINGVGNGLNGIRYLAGKSLVVDNVTIGGFTTRGIDMTMTTNGDLFVRNSHITKAATGVFATTSNGSLARVTIENSHIVGMSANGIEGGANSRINISNSVISGNTTSGVFANSASTRITVNSCQVSFNTNGINSAVAGGIIRLSNNDINNNITGVTAGAGAVETAGNNRTAGNNGTTPLGVPTITVE
ncbi:MAG TPA: right-handed parallel beta-helix repeat-containing protein [Thermoanaerobaculia bacterium]|jgi:hypothetical protein|nr:right-handed parallel beta-helix repeat-containing protein [Thermoanaerobaculia bacterium]